VCLLAAFPAFSLVQVCQACQALVLQGTRRKAVKGTAETSQALAMEGYISMLPPQNKHKQQTQEYQNTGSTLTPEQSTLY